MINQTMEEMLEVMKEMRDDMKELKGHIKEMKHDTNHNLRQMKVTLQKLIGGN